MLCPHTRWRRPSSVVSTSTSSASAAAGVIYASVGGTAILPGDGVGGPNCSSVEWSDNPDVSGFTYTYERGSYRVSTRKIWPDVPSKRAERLSLLPDCSLHITNITTEDDGFYRCENPLSGRRKEFLLILLDVPSSPSEIEAESEDHVTLSCVLHTGFDCDLSTVHPDFNLSWVEVEGTNLWTSTNYQIRKTSACSTTLTVNLTSPAPYSQRRCQVTTGGQVQVSSALYTFGSFLADVYMVVRWAVVLLLLVCAITLEIIWRRRRSMLKYGQGAPAIQQEDEQEADDQPSTSITQEPQQESISDSQ
ncbi:uncharacterized protein LOC134464292 [Engraulis encrasicolus]|uniref:uncharacterized protein LOC134464292 n=1 Tax=Engraulis encrasicolus TaxID=184585 RepID=UPI002FD4DC08